jgi:proline racemase
MTSQEYTQWLKGFLDAVDGYNITKRQFDSIREKLKEVTDEPVGVPIGNGAFITPAVVPQLGGGWISTGTPNIMPLSGTSSSGTITTGGSVTTTQFPKGTNVTYTDTSGNSSSYTIPTTNNIFTNQSSKDDEKLLMD